MKFKIFISLILLSIGFEIKLYCDNIPFLPYDPNYNPGAALFVLRSTSTAPYWLPVKANEKGELIVQTSTSSPTSNINAWQAGTWDINSILNTVIVKDYFLNNKEYYVEQGKVTDYTVIQSTGEVFKISLKVYGTKASVTGDFVKNSVVMDYFDGETDFYTVYPPRKIQTLIFALEPGTTVYYKLEELK